MRGLLIKDIKLLKQQGKFYLILFILAVAMILNGSKDYGIFVTSYLTFMVAVLSFTSFTYDEYDNGMAFLMTLPIGRRTYVKEKYLVSGLLIFGGWLTAVLLRLILVSVRFSLDAWLEDAVTEPIYLCCALIFIACSIPCMIKFGVEKGRTGAMLLVAVILIGCYLLEKTGIGTPFFHRLGEFMESSTLYLLGTLAVICIVVITISYLCALKLVEKKEY